MGVIKAVVPTISGSYKSSGPYCEWELFNQGCLEQPFFDVRMGVETIDLNSSIQICVAAHRAFLQNAAESVKMYCFNLSSFPQAFPLE